MAKAKTKKKAQSFASPFSVLVFHDDMEALNKLADKTGVHKSVLIRLAVRDGLKRKIFDGMIAS